MTDEIERVGLTDGDAGELTPANQMYVLTRQYREGGEDEKE